MGGRGPLAWRRDGGPVHRRKLGDDRWPGSMGVLLCGGPRGRREPRRSSYGTLDDGAPTFTSPEVLARLGPVVMVDPIDGGNHEQMGWYTGQPDDPPATISRSAQQDRIVSRPRASLASLWRRPFERRSPVPVAAMVDGPRVAWSGQPSCGSGGPSQWYHRCERASPTASIGRGVGGVALGRGQSAHVEALREFARPRLSISVGQ